MKLLRCTYPVSVTNNVVLLTPPRICGGKLERLFIDQISLRKHTCVHENFHYYRGIQPRRHT